MKLLLLIAVMLMPATAMAQHHVHTSTFDDYVTEQIAVDYEQDVYSANLDNRINKNASIFNENIERLDGTVAINAANSSIYMTGNDGFSVGVGVGGYSKAVAISAKIGYVSDLGSTVSFNAGVSNVDKRPVVGFGFSHSF